jgi:hypothetical protein
MDENKYGSIMTLQSFLFLYRVKMKKKRWMDESTDGLSAAARRI